MPKNSIITEGGKFMWDGVDYPTGEEMIEKLEKYKGDGFEVEALEEGEKTYLYTRRVVKEVVVQSM